MSLWAGIKDAQIFESGHYLAVGVYDVEVVRCFMKSTQKSGLAFIAELKVVASNNPLHPEGAPGTFFQKMQHQSVAFSSIKAFVVSCLGFDSKGDEQRIKQEIDPYLAQWMDQITGPDNMLAGRRARTEIVPKTAGSGKAITVNNWSPYVAGAPLPELAAAPAVEAPPAAYVPPAGARQAPPGYAPAAPPVVYQPPPAQYGAPPPAPYGAPPPPAYGAPPPQYPTAPAAPAYGPPGGAQPPPPVRNPVTGQWEYPR